VQYEPIPRIFGDWAGRFKGLSLAELPPHDL